MHAALVALKSSAFPPSSVEQAECLGGLVGAACRRAGAPPQECGTVAAILRRPVSRARRTEQYCAARCLDVEGGDSSQGRPLQGRRTEAALRAPRAGPLLLG
jgi:hypothetical protein